MRLGAGVLSLAALAALAVFLHSRGVFHFNHPSPAEFPVRGVDVSHHQGEIDWPKLRADGIAFAFIKASEGADHIDRAFARNWDAARSAGIARGAYHFFTFCSPGRQQAENFMGVVGDSFGELPAVADVEFVGNCKAWESVTHIRVELRAFLAAIEHSSGRRPILYFTDEAWTRILAGEFDAYPRWPRSVFRAPAGAGGEGWTFWQFADNGRVPGIGTLVDLNAFHGSAAEFEPLLGATDRRSPP